MGQFRHQESIIVVIDIFRATTSMCVAIDRGARSLIPVVSVEECQAYKEQGFLAAAERNGEMVPGFDFGNSPYSYLEADLKGKDIAITTTNGTRAIDISKGAIDIVIGSFANISVLSKYLIDRNENIILLCSGWKDRINLEDTLYAGAMVRNLRKWFRPQEDAALVAEAFFQRASIRKRYYIRNSSHTKRLIHLNIQKDVKYCLQQDTHPVIPILRDGRLVKLV